MHVIWRDFIEGWSYYGDEAGKTLTDNAKHPKNISMWAHLGYLLSRFKSENPLFFFVGMLVIPTALSMQIIDWIVWILN